MTVFDVAAAHTIFFFLVLNATTLSTVATKVLYGERAYLYRVEAGKITRVQLFPTRDEALEAAELPEWSGGQTD